MLLRWVTGQSKDSCFSLHRKSEWPQSESLSMPKNFRRKMSLQVKPCICKEAQARVSAMIGRQKKKRENKTCCKSERYGHRHLHRKNGFRSYRPCMAAIYSISFAPLTGVLCTFGWTRKAVEAKSRASEVTKPVDAPGTRNLQVWPRLNFISASLRILQGPE